MDRILGCLREDDPSLNSIKACSTVSKELLPLCRRHIFFSIQLSSTEPNREHNARLCRNLANLLRTSPHISQYIRELLILERGFHLSKSRDWILTDEENLPYVLRNLPRLQILRLKTVARLQWSTLTTVQQASLLFTLASQELYKVEVFGLMGLPPAILSFPNITDLAILLASFNPTLPPEISSPKARLESLQVEKFGVEKNTPHTFLDFVLQPTSPIDLSRLKSLSILLRKEPEHKAAVQIVLQTCQSSLRELEVHPAGEGT